jgi:hypothetical protein
MGSDLYTGGFYERAKSETISKMTKNLEGIFSWSQKIDPREMDNPATLVLRLNEIEKLAKEALEFVPPSMR